MRSMMKGLLGGALAASCSSGLSSHHDDPPREQQSTGRTRRTRSSSQLGRLVNNSQLPLARPPVSPVPPAHPLTPVLLVRPPCALDLWRNVIFRQKRRAQSHPIIAVNLWFTVCVCVCLRGWCYHYHSFQNYCVSRVGFTIFTNYSILET